jgi:nitroreductase
MRSQITFTNKKMTDILLQHRSVRKYQNTPVASEVLNSILYAGTCASTTGNMQAYSIIVSTDSELRNRLWEAHFKQSMVLQAPVHITFCADFNRFSNWCKQRDAAPGFDNFLSFFSAAIDALLVSQNVCLAAEAKGLGICYLGTAVYNADKLIEVLNLPKLVVPVASIVMGYPEETPALTDRLPLRGVVHNEVYHDYSADDIDNIYKEKESMPFYQDLLKINEKATLAQIFTDKRYTRKDNVFFSAKYIEVLKSQGFMNNHE